MVTSISRFFTLGVVIILAACQTTQPVKVASKSEPEIVSSSRVNGKGIPNGRSDSFAPYMQTTKIQLSGDPGYGYSFDKPIRTGPASLRLHLLYLNSLRGPNGETVEYERKGACCGFEDKSLPLGGGLLDVYKVKVDGSDDVITLYVDIYRVGPPLLPAGFTAR
jgi:hypothetical protein